MILIVFLIRKKYLQRDFPSTMKLKCAKGVQNLLGSWTHVDLQRCEKKDGIKKENFSKRLRNN